MTQGRLNEVLGTNILKAKIKLRKISAVHGIRVMAGHHLTRRNICIQSATAQFAVIITPFEIHVYIQSMYDLYS